MARQSRAMNTSPEKKRRMPISTLLATQSTLPTVIEQIRRSIRPHRRRQP
ncbi:MAG: hypothetical protein H0W93_07750 [Gammaproteobacteria bacterium]|nr:hypothetical protein [Gammaproteobacteria bacterium]